jgi:hypothetical protein
MNDFDQYFDFEVVIHRQGKSFALIVTILLPELVNGSIKF